MTIGTIYLNKGNLESYFIFKKRNICTISIKFCFMAIQVLTTLGHLFYVNITSSTEKYPKKQDRQSRVEMFSSGF